MQKIKIELKDNKGISLVTLAISIIIIVIISSIVIYQSTKAIEIGAVNKLYNDLRLLEENVATFYSKYGGLPAITSNEEGIDIGDIPTNKNDGTKYYELDIEVLGNLTLSYGRGTVGDKDIYIINEQSHTVYYLKGVELNGNKYYKLPDNSEDFDLSNAQKLLKAHNSEYVKDGLVLWLDGIDNTGIGHNYETSTWEDLSGNNNDLRLSGTITTGDWTKNAFYFNNNKYFTNENLSNNFPFLGEGYTFEIVYNTLSVNPIITTGLLGLGGNPTDTNKSNSLRFINQTSFRQYWYGNDFDFSVGTATGKHVCTVTYDGENLTGIRKGYLDSNYKASVTGKGKDTSRGILNIGKTLLNEYANGIEFYSVRIYNRALIDDEIKQNYKIDETRFQLQ